jgi:hypothetical protein
MISDKTAKYLSALFNAALKCKVIRVRFVMEKEIPRFEIVNHGKWANLAVYYFSTICILQILAFLIWQVKFSACSIPNKLYTVGLISISLFLLSANLFLHSKYKDCAGIANTLLRLVTLQGKVHT